MIGYVYKIIHKELPICYIGSTTKTLKQRWQAHKNTFTAWCKDKSYTSIVIYKHMYEHGFDKFEMILIRECEIVDNYHLRAIEQLYINKLSTINVAKAFNPFSYQNNRKIRKILGTNRYQKARDKILINYATKIICECGREISKGNLKAHYYSKKHLIKMDTIKAYS